MPVPDRWLSGLDPTCQRITAALCYLLPATAPSRWARPIPAGELADHVGVSRATVSRHLPHLVDVFDMERRAGEAYHFAPADPAPAGMTLWLPLRPVSAVAQPPWARVDVATWRALVERARLADYEGRVVGRQPAGTGRLRAAGLVAGRRTDTAWSTRRPLYRALRRSLRRWSYRASPASSGRYGALRRHRPANLGSRDSGLVPLYPVERPSATGSEADRPLSPAALRAPPAPMDREQYAALTAGGDWHGPGPDTVAAMVTEVGLAPVLAAALEVDWRSWPAPWRPGQVARRPVTDPDALFVYLSRLYRWQRSGTEELYHRERRQDDYAYRRRVAQARARLYAAAPPRDCARRANTDSAPK